MFVVITKSAGDLDPMPAQYKNAHELFPVQTREYQSLDQALDAHPGKRVWLLEEYNAYKLAMDLCHGELKAKRAWWKVWGK